MIACNNAYYLVQVKHEKKMEAQIWVKRAKIRLKNLFFFFFFLHFIKFGSLIFLYIAQDDGLEQCLTTSRNKTHEKNWAPKN